MTNIHETITFLGMSLIISIGMFMYLIKSVTDPLWQGFLIGLLLIWVIINTVGLVGILSNLWSIKNE